MVLRCALAMGLEVLSENDYAGARCESPYTSSMEKGKLAVLVKTGIRQQGGGYWLTRYRTNASKDELIKEEIPLHIHVRRNFSLHMPWPTTAGIRKVPSDRSACVDMFETHNVFVLWP